MNGRLGTLTGADFALWNRQGQSYELVAAAVKDGSARAGKPAP